MAPVSESFSSPPMRCSRPGVPGTPRAGRASGIARRAGSPRDRFEPDRERRQALDVRHMPRLRGVGDIAVRQHDNRHHVLGRDAHRLDAVSKQSAGARGGRTATGLSPCRPYSACIRSDCSVFVGMPGRGPARCVLTTTSGSSAATARPIASLFSARPDPSWRSRRARRRRRRRWRRRPRRSRLRPGRW